MIEGINQSTELIVGVGAAAVMLAGAYKVLWHGKNNRPGWVKGFLQDLRGFRDAILGREAVVDSITREVVQPPLPGIGTRMANQETQMGILTTAVAQIADTHARVDNHEERLLALESAAVERVVTKAESAAAWRAIEAAANAKPDPETDGS